MLTRISLAIAVVLLVSSVVSAQVGVLPGTIYQYQDYNVGNLLNPGISTVLSLVHGDQEASSQQSVEIDNVHSSPQPMHMFYPIGRVSTIGLSSPCIQFCDAGCLTAAGQVQAATLGQDAGAEGECAIVGVNAFLDAAGAQEQTIGAATDPKSQAQSLGTASDQVLMRSSGPGGGWAQNDGDLFQVQAGRNASGSMSELSSIDTHQRSDVEGQANSTASLATSLNACTNQAQVVY